jgi:hypothetical protein
MRFSAWIGYDPREDAGFAVARESFRHYCNLPVPVYGLLLDDLIAGGLYRRPIEMRASAADKPIMWDVVSDAPMSTEHACARFFMPLLAQSGWALFIDGDVMFRGDPSSVFLHLDKSKALYCVHHNYEQAVGLKMDGQAQTRYGRKNWSSVMFINCDHPSNAILRDLNFLNGTPGRDLHRFCWLKDSEIGELPASWNFLVGHSDRSISPDIVHFTEGLPNMAGYEKSPYADEWFKWRNAWARGGNDHLTLIGGARRGARG